MSCHSIGHGMNSVVSVIMREYLQGDISLEPARRLIVACRHGIDWCDGNEYEAVECIHDRCGSCLEKKASGELIDLYSLDYEARHKQAKIYEYVDREVANHCLCASCFDRIANEVYGEPIGPELRQSITG